MKDNNERLDIVAFGRELLETGDLDPLYIALWKAKLPRKQLCQWLVCYWCYYHAGLCCWVSERENFFDNLEEIAKGGTKYPRGTERRHFRGVLAVRSITGLAGCFADATDIVDWLIQAGPKASEVMKRVETLHGFGKWISWKVADMLERLDLAPLKFTKADLPLMFNSSIEGAELAADRYNLKGNPLLAAHLYLIEHLGHLSAPPLYNRPIGVQETETIFCKWKSHLGGHYPVGKDTHEIRAGLREYARHRTSRRLLKGLLDVQQGARNAYSR